jgi:hypothetical protein
VRRCVQLFFLDFGGRSGRRCAATKSILGGHFGGKHRALASRFFYNPIQMSFSGLKKLLAFCAPRKGPCANVGGYMRRGSLEPHKADQSKAKAAHSVLGSSSSVFRF